MNRGISVGKSVLGIEVRIKDLEKAIRFDSLKRIDYLLGY